MPRVEFVVEGNPRPKARPVTRFRDGQPVRTFTPRSTQEWEERVAWAAHVAMAGRAPLVGDVAVELRFYRQTHHACDFDNLAKAILDACQAAGEDRPQGIIIQDDVQVIEAHIYKSVDPQNPRVEARIWTIAD